ncbi:UvrD-helicase domain-containing protein [Alkalihalobacillus sp. FSL W8-0930]
MSMTFNDQQTEAIFSTEPLIVIAAGAGSGKTRVLTERLMHLCDVGLHETESPMGTELDQIAAITFTEKAAREMKQRIRGSLERKAQESTNPEEEEYWDRQKIKLEGATISTFHSFCQRLLKQYAYQAGLPASFQVLDEVSASLLKQEILEELFETVEFFQEAETLIHLLSKDQLSAYLVSVYDQVRELVPGENVVQTFDSSDIWDKQWTALTKEWKEQLKAFDQKGKKAVQFFPSSGLSATTQKHADRLVAFFEQPFNNDLDQYFQELSECMPSRINNKWQDELPSLFELFECEWKPLKKQGEPTLNDFSQDSKNQLTKFIRLLQQFDELYKKQKLFQGALDFTDLQQKTLTLLEDPTVQEATRREYTHIMVDEFQDTNALQLEVLNRINPSYRFIVGDTKQSIYQFRGADVSIMNQLESDAELQSESRRILMNRNYRTVEPIVEAVNSIFQKAMTDSQTYAYQTLYQPLHAHREYVHNGEEAVEIVTGEQEEYDLLANRMLKMQREQNQIVQREDHWCAPMWRDMAILIPTRTHLKTLEQSLKRKQIPYEIQSGIGFYERREVVDFLMLLKWINEPFEDFYLLALLRSPLFGLTIDDFLSIKESCQEGQTIGEYLCFDESLDQNHQSNERLVRSIRQLRQWMEDWIPFTIGSTTASFYQLFEQSGLKNSLLLQTGGPQRVKNVEKLIDVLIGEKETSLSSLLEAMEQRIQLSEKEGDSKIERAEGNAVTIMTVHGSKGLEFPIVFLPQLHQKPQGDKGKIRFHSELGLVMNLETEDGIMDTPAFQLIKQEGDRKAIEEAKRLFYVASTRAKDKLVLIRPNVKAHAASWLAMIEQTDNETWYTEQYVGEYEPWSEETSRTIPTPKVRAEAKPPLVPLSVSEVMSYYHNPAQYVETYLKKIHSNQRNHVQTAHTSGIAANRLGTYVHRASELVDLGWSVQESVDLTLQEARGQSIYRTEMQSLVQAYSRVSIGETLNLEWNFSVEVEGALLTGIIDRVTRMNGALCLIDLKTNLLEDSGTELIDFYRVQLMMYKWAYEQTTGQAVDGLYLLALRDEEQPIHEVNPTEEEERNLRSVIRHLVNLKSESTTTETYLQTDRYK